VTEAMSRTLGSGLLSVKYFAPQSNRALTDVPSYYPKAIGPGNGSLAGKLCSTILSSRRSSIAV
jgi:hypothetical protein